MVGEVAASFDERTGTMRMPYVCAAGHRFIARIETDDFQPKLLGC